MVIEPNLDTVRLNKKWTAVELGIEKNEKNRNQTEPSLS